MKKSVCLPVCLSVWVGVSVCLCLFGVWLVEVRARERNGVRERENQRESPDDGLIISG